MDTHTGTDLHQANTFVLLCARKQQLLSGIVKVSKQKRAWVPCVAKCSTTRPEGPTLSQDEDKVGHGVVVASIQGVQSVNEEVDKGASGGNRAVHLPGLANRQLSLLGLLHLLCNVHCSALGLLQVLDQGNILQDVTLQNELALDLDELHKHGATKDAKGINSPENPKVELKSLSTQG